jgi:predicted AAA+ superfamily ATPase
MRSDYATTLLERDVLELAARGDRVALPRLLRILATRCGTLLNASDLARTTGIARATLGRYLALFVKTFTVQFVPVRAGDVARRLVKSPKVLFTDSGLAAHLAGSTRRGWWMIRTGSAPLSRPTWAPNCSNRSQSRPSESSTCTAATAAAPR